MTTPVLANFSVGQRVYIPLGVHAGNYTVLSIDAQGIDIASPYVGSTYGFIRALSSETVKVYAGYDSNHIAYYVYPYRLIAEFDAIPGLNGEVNVDVSDYLKSIFKKVGPPVHGRDYSLILPFKVEFTDVTSGELYCMNSTVKSTALDAQVNGLYSAIQLNDEPTHFANSLSLYSIKVESVETGPYILNIIGTEGTGNPGGLGYDAIGSTFTID